ncbi:MAG: hypothetical protein L6Q84_35305 [Polyangiaceae bacterium]|nr:hypothetical protein [Polyangiaceae bacterium]
MTKLVTCGVCRAVAFIAVALASCSADEETAVDAGGIAGATGGVPTGGLPAGGEAAGGEAAGGNAAGGGGGAPSPVVCTIRDGVEIDVATLLPGLVGDYAVKRDTLCGLETFFADETVYTVTVTDAPIEVTVETAQGEHTFGWDGVGDGACEAPGGSPQHIYLQDAAAAFPYALPIDRLMFVILDGNLISFGLRHDGDDGHIQACALMVQP